MFVNISIVTSLSSDKFKWMSSKSNGNMVVIKDVDSCKSRVLILQPSGAKRYYQMTDEYFEFQKKSFEKECLISGGEYNLDCTLNRVSGDVVTEMWVFLYDRNCKKVRSEYIGLYNGRNSRKLSVEKECCSYRIVFRFSGSGEVLISDVSLSMILEVVTPGVNAIDVSIINNASNVLWNLVDVATEE
ncbi:hypothetical protein IB655_04950 [Francisella noatunensis]|uniref:Uncharacterized protein n=1 Tax=Francisella noatunensis TaxID=657445 RepID=A0A9Q2QJJ0_9GAMM|nr:hypothetical protein [Francisella noatunensis]MBK2028514.1 hypothetical protein [Francisella noatunensis]MBK2034137.1 hypothetical protein [Francisella noatunensis]MBK2048852.1 hypothetical protein [Francisella noatunensis]MBK2050372.1 hypothetical protein [Francisella noatunensis]MBK2051676.1 hypothetical protein [Francisella noatunensis]